MSDKGQLVEAEFPACAQLWTGASHLHRSIARNMEFNSEAMEFLATASPEVIMRVLVRSDYHKAVMGQVGSFPVGEVESLFSPEDFVNLIYYLSYRSMAGTPPTLRGARLINPSTKNVFIPTALKGPAVMGIRFWAGNSEGYCGFGFRMRFELFKNEDEERERAHKVLEDMAAVTSSVHEIETPEKYMDIAEPISDREAELRVKIRVPGEDY